MDDVNSRRWYQFSIRDLLWLMAVVACLLLVRDTNRAWDQIEKDRRAAADAQIKEHHLALGQQVIDARGEAAKWKALYEDCKKENAAAGKTENQ